MANKVVLTLDLVHKIAGLSNLPLTVDEEKLYTEQLSSILDYIEQLSSVSTVGVEPTFNVTGLYDVLREDKVILGLSQDRALGNAPVTEKGMFKIRKT